MINRILVTGLLVVLIAVVWYLGTALERAAKETEDLVHQAKLLSMSCRGLTFDIRKNLTSNVELQARIVDSLTGSMERMSTAAAGSMERAAARLERLADTLEGAACSTAAGADHVLDEAAVAIRELVPASRRAIDNAADTLAATRAVVDQARAELSGISGEVKTAVAGVRPVLDATAGLITTTDAVAAQVVEIARDGADVAEHYKQMILHPSTGQKIKGWLQLFFSGLTVWANTKTIF